jgi:hypothetical protein
MEHTIFRAVLGPAWSNPNIESKDFVKRNCQIPNGHLGARERAIETGIPGLHVVRTSGFANVR